MAKAKKTESTTSLPLCLEMVAPSADALVTALREKASGAALDKVCVCPENELAKSVASSMAEAMPGVAVETVPSPGGETADAWLLCFDDGEAQANALMELADLDRGIVIAAETGEGGLDKGLFLISIPKAGTHLLTEFAEALGYTFGGGADREISPGCWHFLEFSNSHTAAPDFFNDSLRRAPFGNRLHPFPCTPALFIYRHPYDILVSEANYYHLDGKTAFFPYLNKLSFDERVMRLIDDPRLLGSLRDRINKFAAWLEFDNVIPVSFEELVGESGGGDATQQRRLIWSVILKLQVTADVETTASRIFNPDSPTFAGGKIDAHITELSKEAWGALGRLPSDYLEAFGYQPQPPGKSSTQFGNRIEEFRKRPLRLAAITQESHPPVLIKHDVFGFDLVAYRGSYYAVPSSAGEIDLSSLSPEELADFPNAASLDEIRQTLIRQENLFMGRNIVRFRGKFYGIPAGNGDVDLGALPPEELADLPSADSLDVLKQILIGRIVSQVHTSGTVRGLVGGKPAHLRNHGDYDVYFFNSHLYAIPRSIGLEPTDEDFPIGNSEIIIGHSHFGLRVRLFIRKLRKTFGLVK